MKDRSAVPRRLARFYGEMTSVDAVLRGLGKAGVSGKVTAADLYTRSLDCQNLGGFAMLERIAALATESAALDSKSRVLDVGCGVGGPGRFLADRFGCAVTGIDLLPQRIQAAAALTQMVGLADLITYRQVDATGLPFSDAAFDQAWMLDVGVHIADKGVLFRELARVLKPQGLLALHDHIGPLPPVMRPVARRAALIAPSPLLPTLRHIEGAGFHVLLWRDTTQSVRAWFESLRSRLTRPGKEARRADRLRHERSLATFTAYTTGLQEGMRTGAVIAMRTP